MHQNALAAKVAAQNKANKIAMELYPQAIAALTPFLGQKIQKVDGSLLEKVKKVLPEVSDCHRFYYTCGAGYSLRVEITVIETAPNFYKNGNIAHYREATLYLADLRDSVLNKFYDAPNFRTDFTVEEILTARKDLIKAKEEIQEAERRLFGFGEYDS